MAEEKTVTTTAVEKGGKPEAAEGTTQEKPEAVAKTYDQAYVDDLIERQKAAQEAAVAEALKVAGMDKDAKEKYEQSQFGREPCALGRDKLGQGQERLRTPADTL